MENEKDIADGSKKIGKITANIRRFQQVRWSVLRILVTLSVLTLAHPYHWNIASNVL